MKVAEKANLSSLKSDIDKLHIDKLETVSIGLRSSTSKLDKLAVDKLKPVNVDLKIISDLVEK